MDAVLGMAARVHSPARAGVLPALHVLDRSPALLHDLIEIEETQRGVSVRTDHPAVPGNETNIAHRAAMLMLAMSGRKAGVAITISSSLFFRSN